MTSSSSPSALTDTAPPSRSHLAGLDGLRAVAVVAVMVFHLTPGLLPGGYIGVDVFFVISGFLITALLTRERSATGRIRLGRFWMRRARRLLPALGIVVAVCSSAAVIVGGNVLVDLGRQVLGAATFSSNWLSIGAGRSYFDDTAPELLRNLWSLALEEQFYLVWPLALLLLVLFRKSSIRLAIVGALPLGSATAMVTLAIDGTDATRIYYGTDTHSFGLAIGAVLALLHRDWPATAAPSGRIMRRLLPLIGAVAVVGLVAATVLLSAGDPLVYRGGLVAVALLTAVAIAGAVTAGSWLGRALDCSPLRWIGERSYGLYLWHWPVFVLVVAGIPTLWRSDGGEWLVGGIALVLSVGAATLSYRFIEQPIRRDGFRATLRHWWPRLPSARRVSLIAVAALVATALSAGTVVAIANDPGVTDAQSVIQKGQDAVARPTPTPSESAPRAAPKLPGGDQIEAIGDSVMLASAPELQSGFPGIQIDAVVSRQLSSAPAIVQAMRDAGTLRPVLVIGLGTNGPIERQTLDQLRDIVGSSREIVMVNVQAPRGWTDGVNATLARFAQQYRSVEMANWRDAIAGNLGLLARDQIHPGTAGGAIYVRAIADALQRLAELPPALRANDYGLAGTPL